MFFWTDFVLITPENLLIEMMESNLTEQHGSTNNNQNTTFERNKEIHDKLHIQRKVNSFFNID